VRNKLLGLLLLVVFWLHGMATVKFKMWPFSLIRRAAINTKEVVTPLPDVDPAELIGIRTLEDVEAKREALRVFIGPVVGVAKQHQEKMVFSCNFSEAFPSVEFFPEDDDKLFILYAGHRSTISDLYGQKDMLLERGYSVLLTELPTVVDNPWFPSLIGHDILKYHPKPYRYFFNTLIFAVDYLSRYFLDDNAHVAMAGVSGGGWATVVYSAMDSRIRASYPVAGAIPIYLRTQRDWGDWEQTDPNLLGIANYLEMFVMASSDGRRQVQIFNRYDPSAIQGVKAKHYEQAVSEATRKLGGEFSVLIDTTHDIHQISDWAWGKIMESEGMKK